MVGVDIFFVPRVENLIKKTRFFEKFFTLSEREYILSKNSSYNTIAGLIATKEAVSKAFGCGISKELGLLDIEVLHDKKGRPYVNIFGKLQELMDSQNIKEIHISISHDGDYAISYCDLR